MKRKEIFTIPFYLETFQRLMYALFDKISEAINKEFHLRFSRVLDEIDSFKIFNTLSLLE